MRPSTCFMARFAAITVNGSDPRYEVNKAGIRKDSWDYAAED